MNRVLAVVVAVALAAALAFLVLRDGAAPDDTSAPIEKLLAAGRVDDARKELAAVRRRIDPATADYLEGVILLTQAKDAEAIPPLVRARALRPTDWRIASSLAAATANVGRFPDAIAILDQYVAAVPSDERGLVALAQYVLDRRAGRPDPVKALAALDRVQALPRRFAPPGDPTAVPEVQIRRLRTMALIQAERTMDALLEARIATAQWPQDAEAWFLRGEAARRLAAPRADESLDAYRHAAQLAPGDRRFLEQLAFALIRFAGPGEEILAISETLLASAPDDPSLQLLHARALVRVDRIDHAHGEYRALQARGGDLPPDVRLAVLRNLAVLLYDWKQGGKPGEYLDEAWGLLKEYVRLGGEIDSDLAPTWKELEERARKAGDKR